MDEEDAELDAAAPSRLFFVSAFLAMEPSDSLIRFARECGGGSITKRVQCFILDRCISKYDVRHCLSFVKKFLKKLVNEIEVNHGDVLDELYEQCAHYMILDCSKENTRVIKYISFLFPDDCLQLLSCSRSAKLMIPLQCSLNMLEGDTGCSIWPSSLFLSEFILSNPEIFSSKSCFEVGSGVGLVGICLAHVKSSEVILSDGNMSTLANMKSNLELNQLTENCLLEGNGHDSSGSQVNCIFLPWESAKESQLQEYMPDIILGGDVIYDPRCLPHLVRVLRILLSRTGPHPHQSTNSCPAVFSEPVAYIASVIRNVVTLGRFLALADEAGLSVVDITGKTRVLHLLPYMHSYDRSSVRLFRLCLDN